ncbi:hypothetical protein OY671_010082, partial [Metschnikowia pulcherrima]
DRRRRCRAGRGLQRICGDRGGTDRARKPFARSGRPDRHPQELRRHRRPRRARMPRGLFSRPRRSRRGRCRAEDRRIAGRGGAGRNFRIGAEARSGEAGRRGAFGLAVRRQTADSRADRRRRGLRRGGNAARQPGGRSAGADRRQFRHRQVARGQAAG